MAFIRGRFISKDRIDVYLRRIQRLGYMGKTYCTLRQGQMCVSVYASMAKYKTL